MKRWIGGLSFRWGESKKDGHWPLLQNGIYFPGLLAADPGSLRIRIFDLYYPCVLPLKRVEVLGLSVEGNWGVRIHHTVLAYPPAFIFLTFRPRAILEVMGSIGYSVVRAGQNRR